MKRAAKIALITGATVVVSYVLLTGPMPRPDHWDQITAGTARQQVDEIARDDVWTTRKGDYRIYRQVGLRQWWLLVDFHGDTVSEVKVLKEDPHDDIIDEIVRVSYYVRALF